MKDEKLKDLLFEARWGVKADKKEFAYDKITDALEMLGALAIKDVEPPPMVDLPPEAFEEDEYQTPVIQTVKGVSYKEFRYSTKSKMAEGLVVHYTVSGRAQKNAKGVLNYMAGKGYGCMVMDENGVIYIPETFDILKDAAAHAGTSAWNGYSGLNDEFAGIEICNFGRSSKKDEKFGRTREIPKQNENMIKGWYQPYTEAQEKALRNLCIWLKKKNPAFKFENVCGHDEARAKAGKPGDKTDPGGSLSITMPAFRKTLPKD